MSIKSFHILARGGQSSGPAVELDASCRLWLEVECCACGVGMPAMCVILEHVILPGHSSGMPAAALLASRNLSAASCSSARSCSWQGIASCC